MSPLLEYQHDLVRFAGRFNISLSLEMQLELRRVQAGQRQRFSFVSGRYYANFRSVLLSGIVALWRVFCFPDGKKAAVVCGSLADATQWISIVGAAIADADLPIRTSFYLDPHGGLGIGLRGEGSSRIGPVVCPHDLAEIKDDLRVAVIYNFETVDAVLLHDVEAWLRLSGDNRLLACLPQQ